MKEETDAFINAFTEGLRQAIVVDVRDRVMSVLDGIVGDPFSSLKRMPRNRVPPDKRIVTDGPVSTWHKVPRKTRRKGPIQLCPVPGCKERAAPIFGMVCSKHKGLPKKQIAKYRAARRAKKGAPIKKKAVHVKRPSSPKKPKAKKIVKVAPKATKTTKNGVKSATKAAPSQAAHA